MIFWLWQQKNLCWWLPWGQECTQVSLRPSPVTMESNDWRFFLVFYKLWLTEIESDKSEGILTELGLMEQSSWGKVGTANHASWTIQLSRHVRGTLTLSSLKRNISFRLNQTTTMYFICNVRGSTTEHAKEIEGK